MKDGVIGYYILSLIRLKETAFHEIEVVNHLIGKKAVQNYPLQLSGITSNVDGSKLFEIIKRLSIKSFLIRKIVNDSVYIQITTEGRELCGQLRRQFSDFIKVDYRDLPMIKVRPKKIVQPEAVDKPLVCLDRNDRFVRRDRPVPKEHALMTWKELNIDRKSLIKNPFE